MNISVETMTGSAPRYMVLAETLRTRIEAGEYEIGSLLPTEHTLCEDFNVSRHTVREALRILSESGLIARRRGSGTIVMAQQTKQRFSKRFFGVDAVMNYPHNAKLSVIESKTEPVEPRQARAMDINPHGEFVHIHGLRGIPAQLPFALTDMYLRAELCPDLDVWAELNGAVLEWVATEHMVPTSRIDQSISADILSEDEAVKLRSKPRQAGIRIIRRYFDKGGRILAFSNSIHPADRFSYDMAIERVEQNAS